MYWRWNVNIFVFIQLEILKQTNKETKKQRNKHRCECSVPWRRQRALLPPLSLQTDKSPAQRLSSRCLSPRPPPDAALHTDTAPCSLSASSNFFFFSLSTQRRVKSCVSEWNELLRRCVFHGWTLRKGKKTTPTSESDLRGQVSLSTEITWIIFV